VLSHVSLDFDSLPYYPVSASGYAVLSWQVWPDFVIVLLAAQNAPGLNRFFPSDFSSEQTQTMFIKKICPLVFSVAMTHHSVLLYSKSGLVSSML